MISARSRPWGGVCREGGRGGGPSTKVDWIASSQGDEVLRLVEFVIQRSLRKLSVSQIITEIPREFLRSSSSTTFWNRSARFVDLEGARLPLLNDR
jgi:hypothetical protein